MLLKKHISDQDMLHRHSHENTHPLLRTSSYYTVHLFEIAEDSWERLDQELQGPLDQHLAYCQ